MKLLPKILIGLGGVVAILGLIALVFYVADIPIGANITDVEKGAASLSCDIDIKTKFPIPGITSTVEMESDGFKNGLTCNAVNSGNYVEYYPKSKRTLLYESEGGQLIYDSG